MLRFVRRAVPLVCRLKVSHVFFFSQLAPSLRTQNAKRQRPFQRRKPSVQLLVQDQTPFRSHPQHPAARIKKVTVHASWWMIWLYEGISHSVFECMVVRYQCSIGVSRLSGSLVWSTSSISLFSFLTSS